MDTELTEDNLNKLYSLLDDLTMDDAFVAFVEDETHLAMNEITDLMDVINKFQAAQFPAPDFDLED